MWGRKEFDVQKLECAGSGVIKNADRQDSDSDYTSVSNQYNYTEHDTNSHDEMDNTEDSMATKRNVNFVTIYFPKSEELQTIFKDIVSTKQIAINGILLKLITKDLLSRGLCTKEEYESVRSYLFPKSKGKRKEAEHKNFSLMIPPQFNWIWKKVSTHVGGVIPQKSKSKYVWGLFVKEYASKSLKDSNYFTQKAS